MRTGYGKALYVFLCSLMGMVLFAIFHRALMVIYTILLNSDFEKFSLGLSDQTMRSTDFATLLVALFAGGWYGTGLGLHWYKLVYEDNDDVGLFHGFIPHHWRKTQIHERKASPVAVHTAKERPSKIVHTQSKRPHSVDAFESFTSTPKRAPISWNIEDLETPTLVPEPEREIASVKRKPRAIAKTAKPRKTAVKRATRVKDPETV